MCSKWDPVPLNSFMQESPPSMSLMPHLQNVAYLK